LDLKFPHHENELAQSRAAGRGFARYWMHNAWVTASGEKMSKSLGNGLAVTEVVKKWPARAVRMYLVAPQYRSMVEYSDEALDEAASALARIDSFVTRANEAIKAVDHDSTIEQFFMPELGAPKLGELPEKFITAMDDDLGTPAALAVLHERVRDGNRALDAGALNEARLILGEVQTMLDIFGLRADDPVWSNQTGDDLEPVVNGLVSALLEQRAAARTRKDYASADAIRDNLAQLGLTIEDTPQGPRWTR